MKRITISYHGTNAKNTRKILKEGFQKGTYFARHMEDALGYGGKYIFEVAIPLSMTHKGNWQFIVDSCVPPEFIIRLTKYNPAKIIVNNMVLRHMVCVSNSTKAEAEYIREDMRGNPKGYSKEELIAYGVARPAGRG